MLEIPSIETNITTRCTNCCVGCNHLIQLLPDFILDPKDLYEQCKALSKIVKPKKFTVTGGDCFLHPDILGIFKAIRESGLTQVIQVDTNLNLLSQQDEEVWKSINRIRFTVYPKVLNYGEMLEKAHKYGIEVDAVQYANKFHKPFTYKKMSEADTKKNFNACIYRRDCNFIHDWKFYRCPGMSVIRPKLGDGKCDGIDFKNITEYQLKIYLDQAVPFESCYQCIHCFSPDVKWSQWEECQKSDWFKRSGQ